MPMTFPVWYDNNGAPFAAPGMVQLCSNDEAGFGRLNASVAKSVVI